MVVRVGEDLLDGADDVVSVSDAVVLGLLLLFRTLFSVLSFSSKNIRSSWLR